MNIWIRINRDSFKNLYINGEIIKHCNNIEKHKQFAKKLLFINTDIKLYKIVINIDNNLYISLLLLLIIGLLTVSAGLNKYIKMIPNIPITDFNKSDKFINFIKNGIHIKMIDDITKHIQLLGAWNPKDGSLIML